MGTQGNDDITNDSEENGGEGNDTVYSSAAGYTLGANIENLFGSSAGGQTLTGNDQNNTITGSDGNDTINGRGGADVMIGGKGDDVYFVDNPNDQAIENANEGTDEIRTGLTTYSLETLPNVENLTGIGLSSQTLIGNAGANVITSGAGIDTLIGGAGNDTYVVNDQGDRVHGRPASHRRSGRRQLVGAGRCERRRRCRPRHPGEHRRRRSAGGGLRSVGRPTILPSISRGGGPPEGWWRGASGASSSSATTERLRRCPSTMLRMVPLPCKCREG
jgi:hypothetical protein